MKVLDPVCGTEVDTLRARAVAIVDGTTHYFCSVAHKEQFLGDPGKRPTPQGTPIAPQAAVTSKPHPRATPEIAPRPELEVVDDGGGDPESAAEERGADDADALDALMPARRRASGPLIYVAAVLALAAIAVVLGLLARHG